MTLTIGYKKDPPQLGCDPAEEWIAELRLTGAVLKKVILGMDDNDYTEDADIEITGVDAAVDAVELPGVDGYKGTLHKRFAIIMISTHNSNRSPIVTLATTNSQS